MYSARQDGRVWAEHDHPAYRRAYELSWYIANDLGGEKECKAQIPLIKELHPQFWHLRLNEQYAKHGWFWCKLGAGIRAVHKQLMIEGYEV